MRLWIALMTAFRWRLARLIAPRPIMADPYPDEDGPFVLLRQDRSVVTFRAERFRLKATNRVDQHTFGAGPLPDYPRSASFVRFVGTVAR